MMPIFTGGGWVLLVEFGTFIQFINVLGKLFRKTNLLFADKNEREGRRFGGLGLVKKKGCDPSLIRRLYCRKNIQKLRRTLKASF